MLLPATKQNNFALAVVAALLSVSSAWAQSTGGVTGPKIKEDDRSVEYRIAYAPDRGVYTNRFHYQQALSDRFRLRAIAVQEYGNPRFDFISLTLQAHYQVVKRKRGWNAGFQFQGVIPDGDSGPGLARVAFANSLDVGQAWELRLAGYAARQFGDAARSGALLETRSEATFALGASTRFGAQSFNVWGAAADFAPLGRQNHSAGPVFRAVLSEAVAIETSVPIGLTGAAPDVTLRLNVIAEF